MASSKNYRIGTRHRLVRTTSVYTDDEKASITSYLKNPTSNGLAKLEATWNPGGDFKNLLIELITNNPASENNDPRVHEWVEFTDSPDLLLYFFSRIVETEDTWNRKEQEDKQGLTEVLFDPDDDGIIYALKRQYKEISSRYKLAYQYFKKNIYNPSLGESARSGSFVKSSNGLFVIPRLPNESHSIKILGFNSATLRHLGEFYRLIGKTNNLEVYTFFSPDEELLEPYVSILRESLPIIQLDIPVKRQFEKMIDDLDNQSYMACVSTAGLVVEEYLTQVYETITRSPVPKNLMIGQLTSTIGEIVSDYVSPKKIKKSLTKKELMNEVRNSSKNSNHSRAITATSKTIADYIDDRFNELNLKNNSSSPHSNLDYRIFPGLIKQNIDDITLYRNAASHKSTYPIDSNHALRSLYASLSIGLWWCSEKRSIDGSNTKSTVIKELISRAQSYQ